jgi:hypothetical protein
MANRRLSMRKIKEVLRLTHDGQLSERQVAQSLNLSRSTVKDSYCAMYNLTERRFVAPFENLTLLGLLMGRRRRESDGGNQHGATIQAGVFAIDS